MDEGDAVTLFIERAQAVRADVGDSPAVHELTRRLDGLPLAIELAAARVKLLGPEQLLERIAQRLDLLKGGRDADERHATLRATIALELRPPRRRRTAAVRPARRLPRRFHSRGGRSGLWREPRHACVAARQEPRPPPHRCERGRALLDARDDPRVRAGAPGRPRVRRMPCGGCRPTGCSSSPIARARAELSVSPASGMSISSRPRSTTSAPCSIGQPSTTPSVASPWPRRSRDSGSFANPSEGASRLEPLLARTPDAEPELRGHALRALAGALGLCGEYERAASSYRQSLELFVASGNEIQTANLRYRVAGQHGDDGRDGRRLAAARGITPYIPAARPASRRGPGTRIPRGEAPRRGRSRARDRAHARERRDRPRDWLGMVGERPARRVPPSSSASAEISMPPKVMRSAASSSP